MQQIAGARFPRQARLRGRDSFGRIFRGGEGLRRGELVLKYRAVPLAPPAAAVPATAPDRSSQAPQLRAGFVVRRNAGPNARRNRLRRIMREAYRLERARFENALPDGIALELVFLWSGSPEEALRPDFSAISADLGQALGALLSRMRKRAADASGEQR